MVNKIDSALKRLFQVEAAVAACAYSILAITVLADVIFREIFSFSILGTQRFAVYMSIIAGFLGVSLATAAGVHMRPRVADSWLPEKWNPQINRLSSLVTSIIFGTTGYYAYLFWHTGLTMGDTAPVLHWPLWPIQFVLPYTFFSSALRFFLSAVFPELNPAVPMKKEDK